MIRKNGNVKPRQRGRNVENRTAASAVATLTKFGRQGFDRDAKVTPAVALATALRKLSPSIAPEVGALLVSEAKIEAEATATAE